MVSIKNTTKGFQENLPGTDQTRCFFFGVICQVCKNWSFEQKLVFSMYCLSCRKIQKNQEIGTFKHCIICGKLLKNFSLQNHKGNHTKSQFSNTLPYWFLASETKFQLGPRSGRPKNSSCAGAGIFQNVTPCLVYPRGQFHQDLNCWSSNHHICKGLPWALVSLS